MKRSIIYLSIFFIFSCKSIYQTDNNHHFLATDKGTYYNNDSLNISVQLDNYSLNYPISQREPTKRMRKVLSMADVKKNDRLLFLDHKSAVILKNNPVNLTSFREYSIPDTVINKLYKSNGFGESYYRKTAIHKKQKLMLINDLIPLEDGKLLQILYSIQSELKKGEVAIDPSNPDDIVFLAGWYKEALNLSNGKNGKIDPLKTEEIDPLKLYA